jgi:multidrug resistance efflux pump
MAVESRSQVSQPPAERPSLVDVVEQLARFDGPPEQFLLTLLTVQCRIAGAQGAAILRSNAEGQTEVLSLFPAPPSPEAPTPLWLAQAAELTAAAIAAGRVTVKPLHGADDLYGQSSSRFLILIPIRGGTAVRGLTAFYIETNQQAMLQIARERLELTSSWLSLYEMRLTLQRRQADLRRLRVTMETLVAVNEQERFAGTAMTLCNEVSSRWQADRVGIGLLKGRYIKLKALSHTEKFSRKQKLVQDIEAAMEECIDQNVEIIHPAPENATYVSRACNEMCKLHGPSSLVLMPLRRAGEPMAVLMVQRPVDRPFSLEELEALRLACDLTTPRVAVLEQHDKWVGAKLAEGIKKSGRWIVGPKHTWAKLIVLGVIAVGLFICLAEGDRQAEAPFTLQASQKQVVSAPFNGRLVGVTHRPGDKVLAGDTLAQIRTDDIDDKMAYALAQLDGFERQASEAKSSRDTVRQQLAEAKAREVGAQIRLLQRQRQLATITAPIDGTVLSKDWTQNLTEVQVGQELFEVAPVDRIWAELAVPEDQIADVEPGMYGELASVGYPDQKVRFRVERINPAAEVVDQKNIFRVRVELLDRRGWMRIGVEGVGKVTLGKDTYARLWTKRLVNWVRMKLWI